MRVIRMLIFFSCVTACSGNYKPDLGSIDLKSVSISDPSFKNTINSKIRVFAFVSPECPLCINYSKTLLDLRTKFIKDEVEFYAIFPGTYYSIAQIMDFKKLYNFDFVSYQDSDNELSRLLKATVTPEVILLNRSGEIVYSGSIDDWAYLPGKKKLVVTNNYLHDAIINVISGKAPKISKTEPVGCFIE